MLKSKCLYRAGILYPELNIDKKSFITNFIQIYAKAHFIQILLKVS